MAINKTTTETKNKIKANSVIALPNRPQIPAEQLKQAFVKPIVDTSNSMIQELDRIVEETNAELEQALSGKADLVDGKVPLEQLPLIDNEITVDLTEYAKSDDLATVATTGSYNDLTNKPTIPTVPTISTSITADATDDTKTASPKAVKTYVDNAINTAILGLLGGES